MRTPGSWRGTFALPVSAHWYPGREGGRHSATSTVETPVVSRDRGLRMGTGVGETCPCPCTLFFNQSKLLRKFTILTIC